MIHADVFRDANQRTIRMSENLLCTNVHKRVHKPRFSRNAKLWEPRQLRLPEGKKIGEGGIRTRGRALTPYDGLANRYLQPLGHLSK